MENGYISLETRIQMNRHTLLESENKVAEYIMGPHQNEIITQPVAKAAECIGVSVASIIRFCKKLGLTGYAELKLQMAKEAGHFEAIGRQNTDSIIDRNMPLEDLPREIIQSTINGLRDTASIISTEMLVKAIEAIRNARQVLLVGVSNSAVVCKDLHCKLMRLGIVCHVSADSHEMLTQANFLSPADTVIGISHSGLTKDVVDCLRLANQKGTTTICISNYLHTPLTEAAKIHLLTGGHETSFSSETMVSRISQLAIVDMLYSGLILSDYDRYTGGIEEMNTILADKAY